MNNTSIILSTKNKNLENSIKDYLTKENFIVIISEEDSSVIKRIQKEQPDVAVIDIDRISVQPEYICRKINKKFPRIPQIIITNSNDIAHIRNLLSIPIDDFLIKPVDPKLLKLRILNALDKNQQSKKTYKLGKLKIDDTIKKVKMNNKEVELTPREYQLLKYLVSNRGKVLSRKSILNHVWGYDSFVIDRNVDVYIGYLRKKLGDNKSGEIIKTVPSFGYMIDETENNEHKNN